MSGRCDGCGEVGDVWCGDCLGPHPNDAVATRERYRKALEHIASFDRKALEAAKTLHYDMNGWAKEALRDTGVTHTWLP